MAILFAAAEAEAFVLTTVAQIFTDATNVNTNFVQNGINLSLGAEARCDFTAQTEGWAHFRAHFGSLSANSTLQVVEFVDSGTGQTVFQLDVDGVVSSVIGQFNLEYWNGAAFTEILATEYGLFGGIQYTFDFHWDIDNAAGVFEWYVDGVLVAQFSGDTLNTGYTQIDRMVLQCANSSGSGSGNGTTFSEIIVATTDTRGMRVHAADPTANGTNTAWTNDVTAVDEGNVDDTDFIESGVANDVETFAVRDLSAVADNFTVKAVVVNARALRDTTGPQNMELVVRSGTTDYLSGNVSGLTTAFAPFSYIWADDPDTAAPWTTGGVNAMEVGVKSIT